MLPFLTLSSPSRPSRRAISLRIFVCSHVAFLARTFGSKVHFDHTDSFGFDLSGLVLVYLRLVPQGVVRFLDLPVQIFNLRLAVLFACPE